MVLESEALISIFDNAVMLGDTVTESTRIFSHRPFKLDRLYKSLKVTRIDPGCDAQQMMRITLDVLDANRSWMLQADDCWLVHDISRGRSIAGADPTIQRSQATVMIFTQPLDLLSWARFYEVGCHAVTAMSRIIPPQSLDARIKNRSRMAYTLAEIEVKLVDPQAQGIILDVHGFVAENKGGNIFAITNGTLRTPRSTNCMEGVSRDTVLELAQQLAIPIAEADLLPYDLYTADELFFTSTPYCVMPATKFNGLPVGDGKIGPITRKLLAAWSELVGVDIAAQALNQLHRPTVDF